MWGKVEGGQSSRHRYHILKYDWKTWYMLKVKQILPVVKYFFECPRYTWGLKWRFLVLQKGHLCQYILHTFVLRQNIHQATFSSVKETFVKLIIDLTIEASFSNNCFWYDSVLSNKILIKFLRKIYTVLIGMGRKMGNREGGGWYRITHRCWI